MDKGIKKLILKALLFSLPVLILTGIYVTLDPFKVLYSYNNYMPPGDQYTALNRDFVSTEVFINNYPKYKYDSFIFGNSRSLFYEAADWQPYIKTEKDKILHFDASGESLYGIHQKIVFLDKENVPIKNCLLPLDHLTLKKTTNHDGILGRKHYILSGENEPAFQFIFFKAFLDRRFLVAYFDMRINHTFKPYMRGVVNIRKWDYYPVNNELQQNAAEEEMKKGTYYTKIIKGFKRKDTLTKISPPTIGSVQLSYLNNIKKIFDKDSTSYKIIINPIYDQVYMNPGDVNKLKEIFGGENVFDFSGKNKFTDDYRNYYDRSHYRPVVSREILKIIYSGEDSF
jgi:hypothetical protein